MTGDTSQWRDPGLSRRGLLAASAVTIGDVLMGTSDDLTGLLTRLTKADTDIGYRSGMVTAWNSATGENTITIAGTPIVNVPFLSRTEALAIKVGDVVGILRVRSQYFVLGRISVNTGEIVVRDGDGRIRISMGRDGDNDGVVEVYDDNTDPLLRFGALDSGGWGLEQNVNGTWLPLSQLAGGTDAATATNVVTFNSDTSGFAAVSGGPTINGVQVYTGRMLVTVTAHMLVQDIARMYFGYTLTGAETVAAARERSAFVRGRVETSSEVNATFTVMHTDLTPGTYDVDARVEFVDSQGLPIDDGELGSRTIIVQPF